MNLSSQELHNKIEGEYSVLGSIFHVIRAVSSGFLLHAGLAIGTYIKASPGCVALFVFI